MGLRSWFSSVLGTSGSGTLSSWRSGVVIPDPVTGDDWGLLHVDEAVTVEKLACVLKGTTPSITWTVRYAADRSAVGTEVITGGTTTTSTTTGTITASFNSPNIPANSWVWIEITADSGTVTQATITIKYTPT